MMAMAVSLWYKTAGSHCLFGVRKSQIETNLWSKYDAYEPEQFTISAVCEKTSVEKVRTMLLSLNLCLIYSYREHFIKC